MENEFQTDLELIKKRAISGVVTLVIRTFFVYLFSTIAWFVLTIILKESEFGIFFLVQSMINVFVYFSDIGLAAALIQKKEKLSQSDLATTFTIQQIIILTLVTLGLVFSSKIAHFYNLDQSGLLLLRVLIFSLFLSSLKTIPSILLERNLRFVRFVIPQIAENIVFFTTAIIFAVIGFGITSFTWAVLIRGVVGLALIYLLSPWKPSIGFDKNSARKLTAFGIPFQINSILALLKDDLLVIILGKILSFTQLGYVGWAQKSSQIPIRFFVDNVNKVTFPAYSRLQTHRQTLGKAIEKSLFFVTYLVFPGLFGIIALTPLAVEVIPKYQKWQVAIPLLYLFTLNSFLSSISTTFTNALFAIGKPKVVLNLMVFWTIATWSLTIPLVFKFGFIGVGIASALVALTSLVTIYFVKKEVPITIGRVIFGPLVVSLIMFIFLLAARRIVPENLSGLIILITSGTIFYFVVSFAILKKHMAEDFLTIVRSLINK